MELVVDRKENEMHCVGPLLSELVSCSVIELAVVTKGFGSFMEFFNDYQVRRAHSPLFPSSLLIICCVCVLCVVL